MTPVLRALLLAASLSWSAACAVPEGDTTSPEGVHYGILHARSSGDVELLWQRLHPEVRGVMERWHRAERTARREIEVGYPSEQQGEILEGLALPADADDPKAAFAALVEGADPEALDWLQRLGARIRTVTLDGDEARLRTWAGDVVRARKGDDGGWYGLPSREEMTRLREAAARAEANLERIRRNVAIYAGRRPE